MRFAGFCCNGVTNNVTNILRDYFTDRPCHCPSASEVILRDKCMYPMTPPIPDNMMTSSNGNIFRVTSHLCGEFTGHRWSHRTKVSDAEFYVFVYLHSNKRLSKQWWGWWFETPSCPLLRQRNDNNSVKHNEVYIYIYIHIVEHWLYLCWRLSFYISY